MKLNFDNSKSFSIPDLCRAHMVLYAVLLSELSILAWELGSGDFKWGSLALASLSVLWVVLVSMALLCRIRPRLQYYTAFTGWLLCFAIIEFTGLTVIVLSKVMFSRDMLDLGVLAQQLVALAMFVAMVLWFIQLQQQVIEHSKAEVVSLMDALQSRIKPHFLFNSLNTIAELIASRPVEAEKAVESLSTLFRANLKQSAGMCALSEELTLVKGYLELEKWRLGDRLRVIWTESIQNPSWQVPVLSLQPMVENAVVHGVSNSEEGGEVRVSILQTPKIVTFSIENTLNSTSDGHKGHGVGSDNVQQRLHVLYDDRARFRIEQTDQYYKVTITIPKS